MRDVNSGGKVETRDRHQCLSAERACGTSEYRWRLHHNSRSPMPFGGAGVRDDVRIDRKSAVGIDVTNAFRRSGRAGPRRANDILVRANERHQCLSAERACGTSTSSTASMRSAKVTNAFRRSGRAGQDRKVPYCCKLSPSPMPFGGAGVRDGKQYLITALAIASPMPFGGAGVRDWHWMRWPPSGGCRHQCLSAERACGTVRSILDNFTDHPSHQCLSAERACGTTHAEADDAGDEIVTNAFRRSGRAGRVLSRTFTLSLSSHQCLSAERACGTITSQPVGGQVPSWPPGRQPDLSLRARPGDRWPPEVHAEPRGGTGTGCRKGRHPGRLRRVALPTSGRGGQDHAA